MMMHMAKTAWMLMAGLILGLASVSSALGAVDEHADSGGLPQLDFSTWPTQIFWASGQFRACLYFNVAGALPRIGAVLEERHKRIEGDLKRAKPHQKMLNKHAEPLSSCSPNRARKPAKSHAMPAKASAKKWNAKSKPPMQTRLKNGRGRKRNCRS